MSIKKVIVERLMEARGDDYWEMPLSERSLEATYLTEIVDENLKVIVNSHLEQQELLKDIK